LRFLRQSLTVASKDLRSELRTKESLNAAAAFAVVILLLFSFTTDLGSAETLYEMSGGLLWLVFAFAGALILNRSFARELPNDCLDALIASPVSGAALFFGKAIANFVLVVIIELICLPIFGVFYNLSWARQLGWLMMVLALATWGMTVIGTMFSALTVNLRLRELMLPMLVYPMMIPALMAAMQLTTLLISGQPIAGGDWLWVRLLVGFDIIFTLLSVMLVEVVLVG
jgi:heme exporter protein B